MRIRSWIPCALYLLLAACGQPQTTPTGASAPLLERPAPSSVQSAGRRRHDEFVLFSFYPSNRNGELPRSGLTVGRYGSLFGTTTRDAKRCPTRKGKCGDVYIMAATDSGYLEFPIYGFCQERGCADGASPYAGVTFDKSYAMYGTTYEGGAHNSGVVFKLTPKRNGSYTERVLYSFCAQTGCSDGLNPRSTLILSADGAIYGTTLFGGSENGGVVFKLTPASSGYTESVLHDFTGPDGFNPEAGVVADASGALYGTTESGGGSGCGGGGCGVVFKLTPGTSQYSETVLHEFAGGTDGADPYAGLTLDKHGNLFGVTVAGGGTGCYGSGCGIVFELQRAGSTYTESVLHEFAGTDGSAPYGTLMFGKNGELYGTTSAGGSYHGGTVFTMNPGSSYVFHSFYGFCKSAQCADGETPLGGVVRYRKTIYGTTWQGGRDGRGTVYQLQ